jgi:hypothetical protein
MAEAYYLAMPYLSWQTIIVGDPLCAPFLTSPLPQDRSIPASMPTRASGNFRERLLATFLTRLNRDAVKLQVKALSLQAQGKPAGGGGDASTRPIWSPAC